MRKISFADGRYRVTMLGLVYNMFERKYLKPNDIGGGYLQVTLCYNGIRKGFLIHRLVAEAYIPNPKGYTQINHKDRNTFNNNKRNLEWVSPSENVQHSYDSGREMPSKKGRLYRKLDASQIEMIQILKGEIPIKSIAKYFQVNRATVRRYL